MDKTQFVDELPADARSNLGQFWRDLVANPGKWAEYPGSKRSSPAGIAGSRSKNGQVFEGCRRGGANYVRCVRP